MPAKTSRVTGASSITTKITVLSTMNATVIRLRRRSEVFDEVMNDTDVYAAPITDVIAAAHRISPNTRRPASPAASWNALPAGSSVGQRRAARDHAEDREEQDDAHQRRSSSTPVTELRLMSRTCSAPVVPESSSRCAPAYVM